MDQKSLSDINLHSLIFLNLWVMKLGQKYIEFDYLNQRGPTNFDLRVKCDNLWANTMMYKTTDSQHLKLWANAMMYKTTDSQHLKLKKGR